MSQTEWDYNDRDVLVKHPGEDWRVAVPSEVYCAITKRDDTALLRRVLTALEEGQPWDYLDNVLAPEIRERLK